jgi:putative peptide zinc metalloprotease protein
MAEATQTQVPPRGPQKRKEVLLRIRPDVEISEQHSAGETFYVIKDPLSLRYFRVSELEYIVVSLMDGTNTIEDICRKVAEKTGGLQIPKETVTDFAASLRRTNLLANTFPDDATLLYRMLQARRKARGLRYKIKNILYIKVPLIDPDEILNRIRPYVRFIFTKWFVAFAAIIFLLAARIVAGEWERLISGLEGLLTIENLFYFWLIFIVVKVIHETGHAVSCKHYGGEVHEMGLLFLVFTPCMFTNISDAWTFKQRWTKFVTSFAGIMVEVFVAAIATLVWAGTFEYPGLVHELSYKVMVLCSITSVIFNGNPLMKFDGYYILSDFLQMPNLRVNSIRFIVTSIRKHLFQMPVEGAELNKRTNRIYLIYGLLATAWLASVMTGICVGMLRKFYLFGVWMTFFTVMALVAKTFKGGKFLVVNRRTIGWSGRTRIILLVVLVAATYFLFFFPIDAQVTSTFVLRPKNLTVVMAPERSQLAEVYVDEGQWVEKGAKVMRFENEDLDANLGNLRSSLKIIQSLLNGEKLLRGADSAYLRPDAVAKYEGQLAQTEAAIKDFEDKESRLVVLAPVNGYVISSELKRHIGRGFETGEGLMEIGDPSVMTAEIKVEHQDFGNIREGQKIVLRVKARRDAPVEGKAETKSQRQLPQVSKEVAATAGGTIFTRRNPFSGEEVPIASVYEVTMTVPNPERDLRKGMTGSANIYYSRTTIAANFWKGLISWLKDIFRL